MSTEVETKDCTALSDSELAEMADLSASGPRAYEAGMLSKLVEEWVLVTLARDNGRLKGYSFCTLERIGGTPSLLIGLASIKRTSKRDTVLRQMMTDQLRRSVLAFPDEDVLVGTRLANSSGFEAFRNLDDIVPRPDYIATGEERAWGRRLAKRFGTASEAYDERAFKITGSEVPALVFDHDSAKPDAIAADIGALFDDIDEDAGDSLVAFGWALADDLVKLL